MFRSILHTVLLLSIVAYSNQSMGQSDWLYWYDNFGMHRVKSDGSSEQGIPGLQRGVLVPSEGKAYWAVERVFLGTRYLDVFRADLDGADTELLFTDSSFAPHEVFRSFDYDPVDRKVYWGGKNTGAPLDDQIFGGFLKRANVDGSNVELLISTDASDLALDVANRRVFFSGSRFNSISNIANAYRANLDGTGLMEIGEFWGTTYSSVHVDAAGGKVYWFPGASGSSLFRANLDLTDVEISIFPSGALTNLAEQKVYYVSGPPQFNTIHRANLDGSDVEDFLVLDTNSIHAVLAIINVPHLETTSHIHRAIDARQPHAIDNSRIRMGWQYFEFSFDENASYYMNTFPIHVNEVDRDGSTPISSEITQLDDFTLQVSIAQPVRPGAWTCFTLSDEPAPLCVGALPGDVDGNQYSNPHQDLLTLINNLNGVINPPLEIWQTDIDRSGAATPADILRLIDLFNGADAFDTWSFTELPDVP